MRIKTTLVGTTPLLMHNVRLANPDDYWAKKMKEITSKRAKTEEDRRELARLEWFGSLYVYEESVVIPATNVRKCFQEAAKVTRAGKQITRAVNALRPFVPLAYKGPSDIEELSTREEFRDMTQVTVQGKRVVRCRPIFSAWGCSLEWEMITEVMDYDEFVRVATQAGLIEGLGDNRVGGYGRFTLEVEAL